MQDEVGDNVRETAKTAFFLQGVKWDAKDDAPKHFQAKYAVCDLLRELRCCPRGGSPDLGNVSILQRRLMGATTLMEIVGVRSVDSDWASCGKGWGVYCHWCRSAVGDVSDATGAPLIPPSTDELKELCQPLRSLAKQARQEQGLDRVDIVVNVVCTDGSFAGKVGQRG